MANYVCMYVKTDGNPITVLNLILFLIFRLIVWFTQRGKVLKVVPSLPFIGYFLYICVCVYVCLCIVSINLILLFVFHYKKSAFFF